MRDGPREQMSWAGSRAALVLLLSALLSGCGYALAGRGSFLPEYIETVGIPMFGNRTRFFQIEQVLTEMVRSEFIGRGSYRIMPSDTDVDAVLEGEITSIELMPSAFSEDQLAKRYTFTLTARIVFRDLQADEVIWENQALVFREEYDVATGSGGGVTNANAFFGQDRNAVERVASDFAATVVTSILEAF